MKAVLCSGAAETAIRDGCTPVAGAQVAYFGADQPRITAELLIPWSVFGVAPPVSGTMLRTEVAMTSWHRERWASLSGRPPAEGLSDPAGWRLMRLDDGLAVTVPHVPIDAPG